MFFYFHPIPPLYFSPSFLYYIISIYNYTIDYQGYLPSTTVYTILNMVVYKGINRITGVEGRGFYTIYTYGLLTHFPPCMPISKVLYTP